MCEKENDYPHTNPSGSVKSPNMPLDHGQGIELVTLRNRGRGRPDNFWVRRPDDPWVPSG